VSIGRDISQRSSVQGPRLKRPSTRRGAFVVAGLLLASLAVTPLPGAAAPRTPAAPRDPHRALTIASAQHRIAVLNHQAEIASERMNAVHVRLAAARERLHRLQSDVDRQRVQVSALRTAVVATAVADYQNAGGLSSTTSFLVANDPGQFLREVVDTAVAEKQQAGMLAQLQQQQHRLSAHELQARREVGAIADARAASTRHQSELDAKARQAEHVLSRLRVEQRERLARRQARQERRAQAQVSRDTQRVGTSAAPPSASSAAPTSAPVTGASSRAQIAVSYALAQVGDPYVYGAAGPDAFDCSGLTMAAWAAAGVSIPHASSMQPGAGTPVPISSLLPGDLVFYYSPISHVGMYIGNGQIVHAPHPGSYVEVVPLNSMPIAMAVRIG
jgi:peptidoglycan DL-endopeptidase CwlO